VFEHLRIVALATIFLVGLSAVQNASLASPKPQFTDTADFAATPAETMQSAQARIMASAAFRSVSVGY
jgi:hypothetical protein